MKKIFAIIIITSLILSGCNAPDSTVSVPSVTASSQNEVDSYTDGEQTIILAINSVLADYNNGSLPNKIVWYSDDNSFINPAPTGVSLPTAVDFDSLEITSINDSYLYDYSVEITMPLSDNYSMHFSCGANNEELTDFSVSHVTFSDDSEVINIENISTSFGEFTDISSDRLSSFAQFTNLELNGFSAENDGYISVDKVRNGVTLFIHFADDTDFIATAEEFTVENISQKYGSNPYQTDLDENSIYNTVFSTAPQIINAIITINNLSDSKTAELEAEILNILKNYNKGTYPLPIVDGSEYHINSPFPKGEQIPNTLDKSALKIEANGGSEYPPYVAELALKNGNTMVVFFNLTDPEQKINIYDVTFKDKNQDFIHVLKT